MCPPDKLQTLDQIAYKHNILQYCPCGAPRCKKKNKLVTHRTIQRHFARIRADSQSSHPPDNSLPEQEGDNIDNHEQSYNENKADTDSNVLTNIDSQSHNNADNNDNMAISKEDSHSDTSENEDNQPYNENKADTDSIVLTNINSQSHINADKHTQLHQLQEYTFLDSCTGKNRLRFVLY